MGITVTIFDAVIVLALFVNISAVAAHDSETSDKTLEGWIASTRSADSEEPASEPIESEEVSLVSGQANSTSATRIASSVAPADTRAVEESPSTAERISRLEASLEVDEQRLEQLNTNLNAPVSEYGKAEASFREIDGRRTALHQKILDFEKAGRQDEAAQVHEESTTLEKQWGLTKERFDLAIGERKAMQESVATLQRKLESDRASLLKLKPS